MTDGEEKASYWARGRALWEPGDWRLILLFLGIWAFLNSAAVIRAHREGDWGLTTFGYNLLVMFIWATFLMGPWFVRIFWNEGIVAPRQMFRTMLKGALLFAILFVLIIFFALWYVDEAGLDPDDPPPPEGLVLLWAMVGIAIGGYVVGLIFFLGGYVVCMGLVGMLYLATKGLAPPFLRRVRDLTTSDRWYGRGLAWLFFIPENLDTGTLHATPPVREDEFPWRRFKRAVAWQTIFAMLIAILVSLNPFLLDAVSFNTLFEIMNNAHVIVPILFLPMLVFLRLQARIEGPVKDFHIYVGIRTRLVRTFLAIGTVVLFVRLALEDLEPELLLLRLFLFAVISISIISAFTWLYFNFVENRLARDVVARVPWLVGEEGPDVEDNDEEGTAEEEGTVEEEGAAVEEGAEEEGTAEGVTGRVAEGAPTDT